LPSLAWVAWRDGPALQPLADTPAEHAAAVGFMSDLQFLWAAFWPHARSHEVAMLTSLDHAIYWHAPGARASEWLLFQIESPFAGAERGLVRGQIWAEDGTLVATVVQEGVLRLRPLVPSKL
jgi:acyl-CoA thioesterase-2